MKTDSTSDSAVNGASYVKETKVVPKIVCQYPLEKQSDRRHGGRAASAARGKGRRDQRGEYEQAKGAFHVRYLRK